MMDQKTNNLIEKLKKNIQFLIVLVLFFPTMISAVFESADIIRLNNSILSWGMVVMFCILIFLLVEIWGHRIRKQIAKQIDLAILIEIFFFTPILYFLIAFKGASSMRFIDVILFEYLLIALYLLPIIIFLWILTEMFVLSIKKGDGK